MATLTHLISYKSAVKVLTNDKQPGVLFLSIIIFLRTQNVLLDTIFGNLFFYVTEYCAFNNLQVELISITA